MNIFRLILPIAVLLALVFPGLAFSQTKAEIETELSARESQINQINRRISEYQNRLSQLSGQQAGLRNDIELITNEVSLAELDIEAINASIELQKLQIALLDRQIVEETQRLGTQKIVLTETLFELQKAQNITLIDVVFSAQNFTEIFSNVENLQRISGSLKQSLDNTRQLQSTLSDKRGEQQGVVSTLIDLQGELETRLLILERRRSAISVLIDETKNSEEEYRRLMTELRSEQNSITSRVAQLQAELQRRIVEEGIGQNETMTAMSWPLDRYRITATFHDPTYPFRNLFEHSGIDLAAPRGTPIRAAASGIVAWTRVGASYGNYVMIIHNNNLATLYAHMDSFAVSANQVVARGQVIGTVGSTGFSTGPHLHFEVRSNGIPVNPKSYLP
jgi:murein DD-endopeptidase MepM/ murein hydrolase activator NlpD